MGVNRDFEEFGIGFGGVQRVPLGIKLVGEGEEQFLDSGVGVPSQVVRPGFTFDPTLQMPIKEINAPVPIVTVPFPQVDTVLEPRHFQSTELKGERPAAMGGTRNNMLTPQSPIIPGRLFMGSSSGTDNAKSVDSGDVNAAARNQSAQLMRGSSNAAMALLITAIVIIVVAIL